MIAAKAVAFGECLTDSFDEYKKQVILYAAAMTSRGMNEDDMRHIARLIDRVVSNVGNEDIYKAVKDDVKHFCRQFPLYPSLNNSTDELGKRLGETIDSAIDTVENVIESVVDEVKGAVKGS